MLYIVSYDLRVGATSADYLRISNALEHLGAKRVLFSQWAMRSTASAEQLRNHLRNFIDQNDRILVTEIAHPNWASFSAMMDLNTV